MAWGAAGGAQASDAACRCILQVGRGATCLAALNPREQLGRGATCLETENPRARPHLRRTLPRQAQQAASAEVQVHNLAPSQVGLSTAHQQRRRCTSTRVAEGVDRAAGRQASAPCAQQHRAAHGGKLSATHSWLPSVMAYGTPASCTGAVSWRQRRSNQPGPQSTGRGRSAEGAHTQPLTMSPLCVGGGEGRAVRGEESKH